MSRGAIDLVVFDAGGVLLRICRSWEEACRHAGLPFHPAVMEAATLARRRELSHQYQTGCMRCEEFFERLAGATRGLYSSPQALAVHNAWIIEEYPGVAQLADDLKAAGVRTALLSNTNAAHWERFPEFPVMSRLGSLYASHLLRAAKPDLAAFAHVAKATGVDPRRILFFDDLQDNIAGAQAAGWQTALIDHTGDTAAQMHSVLAGRGLL